MQREVRNSGNELAYCTQFFTSVEVAQHTGVLTPVRRKEHTQQTAVERTAESVVDVAIDFILLWHTSNNP